MEENERKSLARGALGARPIGAFAGRMLDPIARARGFATTALFSEWRNNRRRGVGKFTLPHKIAWPRRREEPGGRNGAAVSLSGGWRDLGAEGGGPRAIEVQHRSEQILERVNRYFGYRAIAELRFLQAPVARKDAAHLAAGADRP